MEITQQSRTVDEKTRSLAEGAGAARFKEYEIAPYAMVVRVRLERERWPAVWYSWLSLKGHLHSFHYLEQTYSFARMIGTEVLSLFVIVWTSSSAIEEWLQQGYSVERMLESMGVPEDDYDIQLMRDFS